MIAIALAKSASKSIQNGKATEKEKEKNAPAGRKCARFSRSSEEENSTHVRIEERKIRQADEANGKGYEVYNETTHC